MWCESCSETSSIFVVKKGMVYRCLLSGLGWGGAFFYDPKTLGVRTNPAVFVLGGMEGKEGEGIGGGLREERRQREEVVVFPLLSWYHASWDDEPDLPPGTHVQQSTVV